jgi:AraC family transcriptional regulator
MLPKQCVAKVLTPGSFEHGLGRNKLFNYSYIPGDLILCNRGIEEWVRWAGPIELLKLELPDQAFKAIAEESGTSEVQISSSTNLKDERIAVLILAVEAERKRGCPSGSLYMDAIAQALASAITDARGELRKPFRRSRSGLTSGQLARVNDVIHARLDRELTLVQMAKAAGLSTAHFSHMFRKSTGFAPHQFVLNVRIEKAKEMLRRSECRIIDVAVACGFQTPQHFARVFRAICKASPTEYRHDRGCSEPAVE